MVSIKNFSFESEENLSERENRLNDEVLCYFNEKLLAWRAELQKEREENLNHVLMTCV